MKIEPPVNKNYAAIVTRMPELQPLDNCDNVSAAHFYGYQAIVSNDTVPGTLGIVFPPETQLSDEYVSQNNLYRDSMKNRDKSQAGYLENNRRVKALKFRSHPSNCLWMPLSSLNYTKVDLSQLSEGDVFDKLGSQEICQKYVVKQPGENKLDKNKKPKVRRVTNKQLPIHFDTDQYLRNKQYIPDEQLVTVTQKLHGTSLRVGNIRVNRKLSLLEKIGRKLGMNIAETEYENVYGSRLVVKDPKDPDQRSFYGTDVWTNEGQKLNGLVPKDYLFYGELVGWIDKDRPVQKNYTYDVPAGNRDLYIYRIAHINSDGVVTDLAWDQVKQMCTNLGLKHVPELWRGLHKDFVAEDWLDTRYFDSGYINAVPLSGGKKLVDEGVVIRVDRLVPYVTKLKSAKFYEHETKLLDKGEVDLESSEAA